jgi:DNA-binding CsgD family transcriptional regulator
VRIDLNERQFQALELAAAGRTAVEIGLEMHVSEKTAKTYLAGAYQALRASNRAHAIARAYDLGILPIGSSKGAYGLSRENVSYSPVGVSPDTGLQE